MRIRELRLNNFMSHEQSSVALPETGIVVVVGPNGAGKSSLVEAVGMAFWGKTLRGALPWGDLPGEAYARADGISACRSRFPSKAVKLAWNLVDDGTFMGNAFDSFQRLDGCDDKDADDTRPGTYESTTHAQIALERLIGPFDIWRRSAAFSSSDAAHFSLATDSERKRLLETILGLDVFDAALERCRTDMKAANAIVNTTLIGVDRAKQQVDHASMRVLDMQRALVAAETALPDALPMPSETDMKRLAGLVSTSEAELVRLRNALRAVDGAAYVALSELRKAEDAVARSKKSDTCVTCGQKLPAGKAAAVTVDLDALRAEHAEDKAASEAARNDIESQVTDLDSDVRSLRGKLSELQGAARVSQERARARAAAEKARASAVKDLANAEESLKTNKERLRGAEDVARDAAKRAATLTVVETVLGLRGVRAHVLGSSLAGLAAVANAWLPRLGLPDLGVALRPYSEKKSGGVTDSISVELTGAGGGNGYKGASAGERRRVDLALLLGIAEVAGAASGRQNGTLFFDELFDALDTDGVKAVSAALVELAQDRCCVVISHNPELITTLPAVQVLEVSGGKIVAL